MAQVVAPALTLTLPAGQAVQADAPTAALNLPGAQLEQMAELGVLNLPTGHIVQADLPAALLVPAVQLEQVDALAALNLPAAQLSSSDMSVTGMAFANGAIRTRMRKHAPAIFFLAAYKL